ncbi:hypothetical protein AYO47_03860 [Planctomyces sp. SCGC AG-212-M04]|nr:hypothetical protein AYO47_03860 [Planctomyces sp. SCGC AG-212-M04]
MPISSLSELSVSAITEEQLLGMKERILVRMTNLMTGDDNLYDYRENGDGGHEVKPSTLLAELRKTVEMINKMLADPASRGDMAMVLSQWDNPETCLGCNC